MKNFNICLELSILIPCYNSEKTLNRLFSSIARQKYPSKYLKIIVVNDGSTDTTSEILFKWKEKLNNYSFTIIEQKNQGIAQTRETLIENVDTKWFTFIDADDYFQKNAFYNFCKASDYESVDIIVGKTWRQRNKERHNWWLSNSLSKNIKKYLKNNLFFIWNKVYKTSFIREVNFHFIKGANMMEDQFFFSAIASKIKKIGITRHYTYTFVQSKNSFSSVVDYSKYEDRFRQILVNFDATLKNILNDRKYVQLSKDEVKIIDSIVYIYIMNIFLLYVLFPAWYNFPRSVQAQLSFLFYNEKRQKVNEILNKYNIEIRAPYGWWKATTYFLLRLKKRYDLSKYLIYVKKQAI